MPEGDLAFDVPSQTPGAGPGHHVAIDPARSSGVVIESSDHVVTTGRRRSDASRPKPVRTGRRSVGRPTRCPPRARLAVAASLVLAAAAIAVPFRARLVQSVPGIGSLFAAMGLPVNVTGLAFSGVTSTLSRESGRAVLMVAGEIANLTGATVSLPHLEIVVRSESGETLYSWSVAPRDPDVAAGASVPFSARLASPPPAGRRILVGFRHNGLDGAVASR